MRIKTEEVERLRKEFSNRAKTLAGVYLLSPQVAIEYVHACQASGIDIAGIEGFKIIEDKIQPQQEHSVDSLDGPAGRHEHSVTFLSANNRSTFWFEVVVECTDA